MADGFNRLQTLQGRKFLYSVKQGDSTQVEKLCHHGVPGIVNHIGRLIKGLLKVIVLLNVPNFISGYLTYCRVVGIILVFYN